MKVLVTGAGGFLGGYICKELLRRSYDVVAVDNLSKYQRILQSHKGNPHYTFHRSNAAIPESLKHLLEDCDYLIAGAAVVGGVNFLQQYPYTMLRDNEKITSATFEAAKWAMWKGKLQKITVISSSQVFEAAEGKDLPVSEDSIRRIPPPKTAYALQKLTLEYFARACWDQHKLPYTIVRPFNTVGPGDYDHVIPQLAHKVLSLKGDKPLRILGTGEQTRHFTHATDMARGIVTCMAHQNATNEDFNLSSPEYLSIEELARMIWHKIKGPEPFRVQHDPAHAADVMHQHTITTKARDRLGFETKITLDEMVTEVIDWVKQNGLDTRRD
jgi:nucleoside-diphosphate-sugar epimerase